MNNGIIKIGLLGVGRMGQSHLRNLMMIKNVEVDFIYDVDKDICEKLANQYSVRVSTNLDKDLQDIDGVVIVTPTFTHFDYIQQVSKYVKNIFIEKPLTDTLESSKEIVQLAKDLNLNIQVGFIERYNAAVVGLKKVIQNNNNIINIDFSRTNKVSSRITDVDVIIDLMIHDIDLALHLNGKVKSINAHGYIKNGMIEYARAIITHSNGSFSNIVASRITEKRIRHISVTCDDIYIDCDLFNKNVKVNRQTLEQYMDDILISSKEETLDIRPQESLLLELMDFIKICQGENIQVSNENDGLLAMEVAYEIQKQIK
jgi:predicted dehydrogenase